MLETRLPGRFPRSVGERSREGGNGDGICRGGCGDGRGRGGLGSLLRK